MSFGALGVESPHGGAIVDLAVRMIYLAYEKKAKGTLMTPEAYGFLQGILAANGGTGTSEYQLVRETSEYQQVRESLSATARKMFNDIKGKGTDRKGRWGRARDMYIHNTKGNGKSVGKAAAQDVKKCHLGSCLKIGLV